MTATKMKLATIITLEQSYSTPATMQHTCKKCSGVSPFHWPGCPDDPTVREVEDFFDLAPPPITLDDPRELCTLRWLEVPSETGAPFSYLIMCDYEHI